MCSTAIITVHDGDVRTATHPPVEIVASGTVAANRHGMNEGKYPLGYI